MLVKKEDALWKEIGLFIMNMIDHHSFLVALGQGKRIREVKREVETSIL